MMVTANPFNPSSITVGRDLTEVAEMLRQSTVQVGGAGCGRGSGVIWRSDGLIVTNAHVANPALMTVQLADGRTYDAQLLRCDRGIDLAAMSVRATALVPARTRDATSLRPGELVAAIGNPVDATGALAIGVVSATPHKGDTLMRADIRLAPGNSGGPLADADGRVVGINSMIMQGFGIAITSSAVEEFLSRNRIGVTLRLTAVGVGFKSVLGLLVTELDPKGAAEASGILVGDVILRVNGDCLCSPSQLSRAIQGTRETVSVDILRIGKVHSRDIYIKSEPREVT